MTRLYGLGNDCITSSYPTRNKNGLSSALGSAGISCDLSENELNVDDSMQPRLWPGMFDDHGLSNSLGQNLSRALYSIAGVWACLDRHEAAQPE